MQQTFSFRSIFNHWYYSLAGLALILILTSLILQALTPKPELAAPAFANIKPGDNFASKQKQIGKPIKSLVSKNGDSEYLYKSSFAAHPNQIYVDKKKKVQFIKEFVTFDPKHTLSQYISVYGKPDLVLFDSQSPDSVRAHVFLRAGLVIIAHVDGGVVEQKWLFIPATKEEFLANYGSSLSESKSGPEIIPENLD